MSDMLNRLSTVKNGKIIKPARNAAKRWYCEPHETAIPQARHLWDAPDSQDAEQSSRWHEPKAIFSVIKTA